MRFAISKIDFEVSKRLLYTLGVGACLVALTAVGTTYWKQIQERNEVAAELEAAQERLAAISTTSLSNRPPELEAQLAKLHVETESLKSDLSPEVISPDVSDTLFATAAKNNVELTSLSSTSRATSSLENVPGLTLPLILAVSGNVPSMLAFIDELNVKFPTGVVREVDLTIPVEGKTPYATMKLDIYAYEGE